MDLKVKQDLQKLIAELAKSTPEIKDLFSDFHAMPSKEELKTGPGEAASGAGAEHMISQYSETAAQVALAEEYKRLSGLLADFPAIKSELAEIKKGMTALFSAVVSKGGNVSTVSKKLESALVDLGVLKATKADAVQIQKAEKRISDLRGQLDFLRTIESGSLNDAIKAASDLSVKAEDKEEEEEEEKKAKAKAEEEEEKKEKEEKEKAEKAAYAKAVSDISSFLAAVVKGDEAAQKAIYDGASETVKSQLDALRTSVKSKANEAHDASGKFSEKEGGKDKKDETEEVKALREKLDELAGLIAKASVGTSGAPNLNGNNNGAGASTIRDRVMKAIENDELPGNAGITATSLLTQYERAEKGEIAKSVFDRSLQLAPPSVQTLFRLN